MALLGNAQAASLLPLMQVSTVKARKIQLDDSSYKGSRALFSDDQYAPEKPGPIPSPTVTISLTGQGGAAQSPP